jgi:hypothetical protein
MGIYEELKFLAPHDFAQQKAQFDAAATAPTSALGSSTAPATGIGNGAGAPIAGNAVTKDGLLAALNR